LDAQRSTQRPRRKAPGRRGCRPGAFSLRHPGFPVRLVAGSDHVGDGHRCGGLAGVGKQQNAQPVVQAELGDAFHAGDELGRRVLGEHGGSRAGQEAGESTEGHGSGGKRPAAMAVRHGDLSEQGRERMAPAQAMGDVRRRRFPGGWAATPGLRSRFAGQGKDRRRDRPNTGWRTSAVSPILPSPP